MRILYVVTEFPKLSESFVLNELVELKRRGHDVAVFAIKNPNETIAHDEVDDFDAPVHYATRPRLSEIFFDSRQLTLLSTGIVTQIRRFVGSPALRRRSLFVAHPKKHALYLHLANQMISFVDSLDWDIDLIHGHFASETQVPATAVAAYYDVPFTVTAHANEIYANPDVRQLDRIVAGAERVITPSEYNRNYLADTLTADADIDVVPATTRVEAFEPTERAVPGRIFSVCRLVEKKGLRYAIDAVATLRDEGYDVEYRIAGAGPLEAALREQIRSRDLESCVDLLGRVTDARLERELDEAAVFALPCVIAADGDRDVMPVVLKEAMAMKTACVSTCISAIPELIEHEVDGLLVEPRDSDALADAIAELLSDSELRRRYAASGRRTVEQSFDVRTTTDDLCSSFRTAIREYEPDGVT